MNQPQEERSSPLTPSERRALLDLELQLRGQISPSLLRHYRVGPSAILSGATTALALFTIGAGLVVGSVLMAVVGFFGAVLSIECLVRTSLARVCWLRVRRSLGLVQR